VSTRPVSEKQGHQALQNRARDDFAFVGRDDGPDNPRGVLLRKAQSKGRAPLPDENSLASGGSDAKENEIAANAAAVTGEIAEQQKTRAISATSSTDNDGARERASIKNGAAAEALGAAGQIARPSATDSAPDSRQQRLQRNFGCRDGGERRQTGSKKDAREGYSETRRAGWSCTRKRRRPRILRSRPARVARVAHGGARGGP
jgi:hypothetical protein